MLPDVAAWGRGIDSFIASDLRNPFAVAIAAALTYSATPEVTGIGLTIAGPLALIVAGRRLDALKGFVVLVGSLGFAAIVKAIIVEPRPPQSLWAIAADSGASYPSGHTTVAAAAIVASFMVACGRRWRMVAAIGGGIWVLAVAASRVYLVNHHPWDVLGSILVVLSVGMTASGLIALPALQSRLIVMNVGRSARQKMDRTSP
ncbi:phosphatase PAP2 family protein (plasmid) [Streptomyces sp. L7]|uniref:phosphatase PAP2 family protein n=1 Tax=Streptomyces sp. L7 TaxID=3423954 RepID=UPI003D5762CD